MNNNNKSELGSFYIRQILGIHILSLIFSFIPVIGWILIIVLIILWVISLLGALGDTKNQYNKANSFAVIIR